MRSFASTRSSFETSILGGLEIRLPKPTEADVYRPWQRRQENPRTAIQLHSGTFDVVILFIAQILIK
jgi:hypothetical protein